MTAQFKRVVIFYKDNSKPTKWEENADILTTLDRVRGHIQSNFEMGGAGIKSISIIELEKITAPTEAS